MKLPGWGGGEYVWSALLLWTKEGDLEQTLNKKMQCKESRRIIYISLPLSFMYWKIAKYEFNKKIQKKSAL